MKINVRKANLNDLSELVMMGQELYKVEKKYEPLLKFSLKESEMHYKRELSNGSACFLIAEDNSIVMGYLYGHLNKVGYFSTDAFEAEIEVVYLKPNARGKGVVKYLVDEFSKWAKHKNAFRIKAGIYEKNHPSRKLFSKISFKPYHTTYIFDLKKT